MIRSILMTALCLTVLAACKKAEDASPSSPVNPQTAACRIESLADSAAGVVGGYKSTDYAFDSQKRPTRINTYTTVSGSPVLSSYRTLTYSGSTVTLRRFSASGVEDTSQGITTATISNGLVTKLDYAYTTYEQVSGVSVATVVAQHNTYRYSGNGILAGFTQQRISTPQVGGGPDTNTTTLKTTVAGGLVTRMTYTYYNSASTSHFVDSLVQEVAYGTAKLAGGSLIAASAVPGYPFYTGDALPLYMLSTTWYTTGIKDVSSTAYAATLNADHYVSKLTQTQTSASGASPTTVRTVYYTYSCSN